MLRAMTLAVFAPRRAFSARAWQPILSKWGWAFIFLRWGYYSSVFALFRDYQGKWRPFVSPPFGLTHTTYGRLQVLLAVPFGVMLMGAIAAVLWTYLRLRNRSCDGLTLINILGVTYFLPFVILQPLDVLAIQSVGWAAMVIIPLHNVVLMWEAVAATTIIGELVKLRKADHVVLVLLQLGTWIGICAPLWR